MTDTPHRIARINLELGRPGVVDVNADHERRIAVADLLEANFFRPEDAADGPFFLRLAIEDDRLVFDESPDSDRVILLPEFDITSRGLTNSNPLS